MASVCFLCWWNSFWASDGSFRSFSDQISTFQTNRSNVSFNPIRLPPTKNTIPTLSYLKTCLKITNINCKHKVERWECVTQQQSKQPAATCYKLELEQCQMRQTLVESSKKQLHFLQPSSELVPVLDVLPSWIIFQWKTALHSWKSWKSLSQI